MTHDYDGQSNEYFSAAEEDLRRQIFLDNVALIRAANERFDRGLSNYRLRVNRFADLRFEEFVLENTGVPTLGGSGQTQVIFITFCMCTMQ